MQQQISKFKQVHEDGTALNELTDRLQRGVSENEPCQIKHLEFEGNQFRHAAACISWIPKTGSAAINAFIRSLLRPGSTDTRSLSGNLSKPRREQMEALNKRIRPENAHKENNESPAAKLRVWGLATTLLLTPSSDQGQK